jgi:hypothetical protein
MIAFDVAVGSVMHDNEDVIMQVIISPFAKEVWDVYKELSKPTFKPLICHW